MSNTFEDFKRSSGEDSGSHLIARTVELMLNDLEKAAFYAGRESMRQQVLATIDKRRMRNPAMQDLHQELEKTDVEEEK
jgi:hypothetical protein